jgi:hypothetical protein
MTTAATKAPLFAGLEALAAQASARKQVSRELVDAISVEAGFPSRPVGAGSGVGRPAARRYRTGRNVQLNLKAKPETVKRMGELADELGVPLAVVLELALEALGRG